ncbi:hypothetical protein [Priestia aryabhattai]
MNKQQATAELEIRTSLSIDYLESKVRELGNPISTTDMKDFLKKHNITNYKEIILLDKTLHHNASYIIFPLAGSGDNIYYAKGRTGYEEYEFCPEDNFWEQKIFSKFDVSLLNSINKNNQQFFEDLTQDTKDIQNNYFPINP